MNSNSSNNNNSIFSRNTMYLLAILNLVYIAYYVMLAFYSRFHFDDLHFLWRAQEMSLNDFVVYFYKSWSGRFVSYFKVGLYSEIILLIHEYRYLPVLLWAVGVGMCWYVTKSIFNNASWFLLLNIVMIFYNIYVLTNIDFAVFNWLCAMDYYLLAPMLLFVLCLVNKHHLTTLERIFLFIATLLFGGGQEIFTPIVLVALFFNTFYYFKKYNFNLKLTLQDKHIRKILIVTSLILVCYVIVILAPGNYNRMSSPEFVTPTSLFGYLVGYAYSLSIFSYQFSFYLHYYALLGVMFVMLGKHFSSSDFNIKVSYKSLVLYSIIIYATYVLLTVFPIVYLWSGYGIQRNYTPMVFLTMLFMMFHAFLFGYFKSDIIQLKILKKMLFVGLLFFTFIMAFNFYSDSMSAKKYADSVDERLTYLQMLNAKGVKGEVEVAPIFVPYTNGPKYLFYELIGRKKNTHPVLYYISDTENVPNEYSMHYCKYYGFRFQIKLKKLD